MFVGQEGTVYAVLPNHDASRKYTYTEAPQVEGTVGFLFLNQKYHAVTFRSGEWKPSFSDEFMEYYDTQYAEWIDVGAVMPLTRRLDYQLLYTEICEAAQQHNRRFYL